MVEIFTPLPLEDLWRIVASEFRVTDGFLDAEGIPTFILPPDQETKEPFKRLLEKLDLYNLLAMMRYASPEAVYTGYPAYPAKPSEKVIVLRILPKEEGKPGNPIINVLLLIVTTAAIVLAGYYQAESFNNTSLFFLFFFNLPLSYESPIVTAIYYTLAIYGIIGLHEMAHYLTAKMRGVEASLPYFIPGWPFGTFGAVIMQKSPITNRDELFDLGFSGPITSFIITLIVAVVGIRMAPVIPWPIVIEIQNIQQSTGIQLLSPWPVPVLYMLLDNIIPKSVQGVELLHPLTFAAWAGMLVVALNFFPIGQLDGGHCARAVLDTKKHFIVSMLSSIIMALLGYLPMALLALLLSLRGHPGPLDDVSKVGVKRKIGVIAGIILAAICIPPLYPIF
ncbi:MAG: site-2 protease family protein [Candidatus Freyarchaeota archaeon]|nr:site-2 protease family protein [Candidatus Freyrarchaeum guaymaensis]